jgi:hypothetical protein
LREQTVNAELGPCQVGETSDRHDELGRRDITERLELPFVTLELESRRSVPDPLCPVLEESVRDFVG